MPRNALGHVGEGNHTPTCRGINWTLLCRTTQSNCGDPWASFTLEARF